MKNMKSYFQIATLSILFLISGCKKDEDVITLVANAGSDQVVKPTKMVTLNGSGSSGPDGFTYSWKYSGLVPESEINFQNSTSASPSFIPPEAGLYSFTLTISANGSSSEDVVLIEATGALTIGGTLTENTTLKNIENDPDLADYFLDSDLIIPEGITLTIESHVKVDVAENKGIIVRGTFTDVNQGVYYTDNSLASESGWKGILVDGGTLNLGGINITNAGASSFDGQSEAASVIFTGNAPTLSGFVNNVFVGSHSYDMLVETAVSGINTLEKNTFSAQIPVKAPFDFIRLFSGKNTYPANYKYLQLTPNPVETGNQLPVDEYYFLYQAKYYIDGSLRAKSALITGGLVTIYMKANSSLIFENYASIGSNYEGVSLITGFDEAKWNGIAAANNTEVKLNDVVIRNAGAAPVVGGNINSPVKAAVYQQGIGTGWIWNSTIQDCGGYGFYLDAGDDVESFFEIKDSKFINTQQAAIRTNVRSVLNTIKSGVYCDLAANVPGCLLEQDGQVNDFFWPEIENSYYLVDANISFSGLINFNPGVHMKFKQGRSLSWVVNGIYDPNQLFFVNGEANKPVIFEGEADTPGSWGGLVLEGNFNINYLQIKNAGEFNLPGASTKANLFFNYKNFGVEDFWKTFSNCEVSGSAGYGIVMDATAAEYDFLDPAKNNTFSNNNLGDVYREGK